MITRHRREFEVRRMCGVLEVRLSEYDASRQRPPSWHALIDEVLLAHVRIAHDASGRTYGAPWVHRELQAEGLPTSTKHDAPIAPNRLARQFDVNGIGINRIWVADITHILTREGPLYMAAVLDLGSRRCVGWAVQDSMEVELVASTNTLT